MYNGYIVIHRHQALEDEALHGLLRETSHESGMLGACVSDRACRLMVVDFDAKKTHAKRDSAQRSAARSSCRDGWFVTNPQSGAYKAAVVWNTDHGIPPGLVTCRHFRPTRAAGLPGCRRLIGKNGGERREVTQQVRAFVWPDRQGLF
jgi:hypothetical protein